MTCADCARLPGTLEALVGWRHHHGSAPCWWFVREVYLRHRGLELPVRNVLESRRRWREIVDASRHLFRLAEVPMPYDLVLLRSERLDHVGLLAGPDDMIHLMSPAAGVCRSRPSDWAARGWRVAAYRWAPSA